MREALHAPAARDRALFDPAWVARLLAEPNEHLTTLQGNSLWQLGLLELWLQTAGRLTERRAHLARGRDSSVTMDDRNPRESGPTT